MGIDEITARLKQLCVLTRFPTELLDRYPVELSGGEQRRVSLTRALMLEPEILLLDEPLGALDPMARASLLRDLKALFERTNTTVIVVTHNLVEAARLGDWIVLLKAGRIVQQGAFAEFSLCPAEPFVSEFFRAQTDEVSVLKTHRIAPLVGTSLSRLRLGRKNPRSALGSKKIHGVLRSHRTGQAQP